MDLLDRLLGRDEWATRSLLELSVGLSGEQLDQPFDVGLGTLRKTLRHIVRNISFWAALATGRSVDDPPDLPTIAELIERYDRGHSAYAAFARQVHDEGRLDGTFIDHWNYPQSMGGTVIQVLMHNEEHRTEALHILKRLGVPDLPELDPQAWEHLTGKIYARRPSACPLSVRAELVEACSLSERRNALRQAQDERKGGSGRAARLVVTRVRTAGGFKTDGSG